MSSTTVSIGRRAALSHPLTVRRARASAPLAALLALAAFLYLWGLSHNGYGNQYYAAAVEAGARSWKAFLFGSLDPSNYITVDKPPASLWLMELSSRLLGFSSFSMLLPQALEGVAAVALLYATVRRWFGRPAALISGLVLALTPVAALMFSFNNPDALLVALMVASAHALTRALEHGSTRWLALAGALVGFAFLTKMMQAFLVVPAFGLAYLVAAPVGLRRRVGQLAAAGAAIVLSAGWWVAVVELWPASARPYIGGSTNNSILQLIFGYNGLDRISGGAGPGGGGGGGGGFSGTAGLLRLFNSELGAQISWLLPAAGIAIVAGAIWTARRPRTDRTRSALLIWGGWLVLSAAVFSFMSGIIHPYYTNTLAPAIAAVLGVCASLCWQRRRDPRARIVLASMLACTAVWSFLLLDRVPSWHPWLRFVALIGGLAAAVALLLLGSSVRRHGVAALVGASLALGLAAPAAYTLSTASAAQSGQNPSAGPAAPGAAAGGFSFRGFGVAGRAFGAPPQGAAGAAGVRSQTSRALVSLVTRRASQYTWAAATTDWQTAASIELASSGSAVMAIGGFSGTDNMTLARFEALVKAGKIHYFVSGGGIPGSGSGLPGPPGGPGGSVGPGGPGGPGGRPFAGGPGQARGQRSSEIESWVASHFRAAKVGAVTVYDLTQAKAGA